MKIIDIDTWDRKEHFLFFRNSDCGHYHIGANLDITNFKNKTKAQGIAFSFAMTYAVTVALNQVEAFRYRLENENVVLHEVVHPSFTYVAPNLKYFKMVTVDLEDTLAAFVTKAKHQATTQEVYFDFEQGKERSDLIFLSSIPKVSFTHLSHTLSFHKNDVVPRISWGKYYQEGDTILIPFNVQAHHAFVDGNDMGDYFEALQHYFDTY